MAKFTEFFILMWRLIKAFVLLCQLRIRF
uniref:Uncharacterized protein n=1 Tax=Anguilla anguilla TaxID=7936 RepID=A0A0E9V4R3_ANGAN